MSRKYKFREKEACYFVSFATVYWIDVFTRRIYIDILIDSLNYCAKNKGLIIYGWVIMTNHVHLIIATKDIELQDILRDLKKFTSKAIITAIKENQQESRKEWMLDLFEKAGEKNSNNLHYQFWQQHNHPIILDSNFLLDQKLNYVHDNPVKAGFVEKPEDYSYSSARDYMGIKGLIGIEIIE